MEHDKVKNLIQEFFKLTNSEIKSCEISNDGDMLWCSIYTPDSRFLIGHEGEVLRSLNHIIKKIVEKNIEGEEYQNLLIDINDYQKKHFDNLKATAHMLAERARYFKSNIEASPMSAFDRRILHTFLQPDTDIKTESIGDGKERRVVIKYISDRI